MNGCIYRTKDGECDAYSEGGKFKAYCDMEHCDNIAPSNADRIRAMSDEELAEFICSRISDCNERCPGYELCRFGDGHSNGLIKWLKQEAKE